MDLKHKGTSKIWAYSWLSLFFYMIFLSLIFVNHFSYASNINDVLIETESQYDVTSGQVVIKEILIKNNGTLPINVDLSYSTNLIIDDQTIGFWNFNEGNGTALSDELGSNDGVVYGASWTKGKFGLALNFDGFDDFVSVPDSDSYNLESFTIETWIKLHSAHSWTPIGGTKYESFGLYYREDGIIRTHVWGSETGLKWYDTNKPLTLDTWHYLTMTYNSLSGELAWFLDGVKIDSRFEGSDALYDSSSSLVFGRGWTETMWDLLDGEIDEIRISNFSREKVEIAENYRRALSGDGEWLTFSDTSMTIQSNSSIQFEITIDASSLAPGTYYRELYITNSANYSEFYILPITLEVVPTFHDISIENMILPSAFLAGQPIPIQAEISNQGTFNETNILALLYIDGILVTTFNIPHLAPEESTSQYLEWTVEKAGISYITLYVAPFKEDDIWTNNAQTNAITIIGRPSLWVNSSSLKLSLTPNEISKKTFIIGNNGTDDLTYQLRDSNSKVIFNDDLDLDLSAWVHEGDLDSWELGEPELGPRNAYSGTRVWGTDLSGPYDDSTNCSLVSPSINLNNRIQPILSFYHWYSTESYSDFCYVEIWDGDKWVTLNQNGFSGESRGWIHETYNLHSFIDKLIRIRFRFEADDQIINKGWYIDDVSISDFAGVKNDNMFESAESGEIPPNSFEIITVTVNSSNLNPGNYLEFITIRTNDPEEYLVTIPVYISLNSSNIISNTSDSDNLHPWNTFKNLQVNEDEIIILNGSRYYNISVILDYTWSFLDGNDLQLLRGASPTYVFETPGTYQVTLIATDFSGNQESDNITITVLDVTNPVSNAGQDTTLNEDDPLLLDGSRSYDNVGISNYTWSFLDGNDLQLLRGASPTYVFETPGTYQVTLIATDFSGNQESDNITITVLDVTNPVSNAGQDIGIRIEEIMTFNGNLSSDNVAIILFEWDFGDGIKEEGIEVTHFYLKTQTYNVSLTVFDERGNSNTDWMLVTVNPASHNTNLLFIAMGFILLVILVFVFTRFNPKKKTETKEIPLLKER